MGGCCSSSGDKKAGAGGKGAFEGKDPDINSLMSERSINKDKSDSESLEMASETPSDNKK